MATFEFNRPAAVQDEDAGRVHDWLKARGVAVSAVTVRSDGTLTVSVPDDVSRETLRDVLASYARAETARETFEREAIADALQLVKAIAAKPPANRTPVERSLLGLALAIRDLRQQV